MSVSTRRIYSWTVTTNRSLFVLPFRHSTLYDLEEVYMEYNKLNVKVISFFLYLSNTLRLCIRNYKCRFWTPNPVTKSFIKIEPQERSLF